jgi:hypothetical protein
MTIPDISLTDNPDFTVKGFTEIKDNTCNVINYKWLAKTQFCIRKKCKQVISKKKLKFYLITLSFQMWTSNMHMPEQKIQVNTDEISTDHLC